MISSKVFALSLLLVCPLALARVQMHTQAKLKNNPVYGNHSADVSFNIDINEKTFEIYNHNNMRVVAELLAEKDNDCTIHFSIGKKSQLRYWFQITQNQHHCAWVQAMATILA